MRNIQSNKKEADEKVKKIILALIHDLSKIQFFHQTHKNNAKAYMKANKGSLLKQSEFLINNKCLCNKWICLFTFNQQFRRDKT